jgi:hypothetical protein
LHIKKPVRTAKLVTALADADKAYAASLNTAFYKLEDQAEDRAIADEEAAKTREIVRFLQRIADLQDQIGKVALATAEDDALIRYVGLENPSGVPPQPGRPPRTGDLVKDLLNDLAYFERIGLQVRAGSAAVYEDDNGNMRNGFTAFGVALAVIKDGFVRMSDLAGMFGGPIGAAYSFLQRLPETLNAIAEGDPAAIRSALTGLLVRLPGGGLISMVYRMQGFVMAGENLKQASAEYEQSGDKMLAGLRLTGAAIDFYHGAKGAVQGIISAPRSIANAYRGVRNWLSKRSSTPPKLFDAPNPPRRPATEKAQTERGVPQRGRALEEQWRGLAKENKPNVNEDRSKRITDPKKPQTTASQPTRTSPDRIDPCVKGKGGCFARGEQLMTREGGKAVEQFRKGDKLFSRDENDPEAPVVEREVEETFVRFAKIFHLHVGSLRIRTTPEHAFYVRGKGWTNVIELRPGDELSTREDRWIELDAVEDTGEFETVYNMRVAGDHTYFVGNADGAAVWAHNTGTNPVDCPIDLTSDDLKRLRKDLLRNDKTIVLEPNTTYRIGTTLYKTNAAGQVEKISFRIDASTRRDGDRIATSSQTSRLGQKLSGVVGDIGFHLHPDKHNGASSYPNVIPANGKPADGKKNLNQGPWGRMEKLWEEAIDRGHAVSVQITLKYAGKNDIRPRSFDVTFTVNGKEFQMEFRNAPQGSLPSGFVNNVRRYF